MTRSVWQYILVTGLAVWLPGQPQAWGDVLTFQNQPKWLKAVGGSDWVTVFHFDNKTETHGRFAHDPKITPSYADQGVYFLPFTGTEVYPVLLRGQGHQIPDPNRDGLLTNVSSPNPVTDLDGRAIKFLFTGEARSVGVFTNRLNGGDGGVLRAYDGCLNFIGEVELLPGVFGGIVSDQLIFYVEIINTYDRDIRFGIWDLQFSPNGLP